MKHFFTFFFALLFVTTYSQNLQGSWLLVEKNGKPVTDREEVALFTDNYFAVSAKSTANNEFLYAYGGYTQQNAEHTQLTYDFNTQIPETINKSFTSYTRISGDSLIWTRENAQLVWRQISNRQDELSGVWVFTGRERDGKLSTSTPGDRRTIKILTGGRFQWIAFNSATTEFSGTGGGFYHTQKPDYTEQITVFSRNKDRIGASLEFNYQLKEGVWHHTGTSSGGDKIYELWSPLHKAYSREKAQ
ncbi:MAG: hypothetical protein Q4F57_02675 [Weeksellaceae bacterium]|nr:hypothetical protein [Weeksellaceae bacterium]